MPSFLARSSSHALYTLSASSARACRLVRACSFLLLAKSGVSRFLRKDGRNEEDPFFFNLSEGARADLEKSSEDTQDF